MCRVPSAESFFVPKKNRFCFFIHYIYHLLFTLHSSLFTLFSCRVPCAVCREFFSFRKKIGFAFLYIIYIIYFSLFTLHSSLFTLFSCRVPCAVCREFFSFRKNRFCFFIHYIYISFTLHSSLFTLHSFFVPCAVCRVPCAESFFRSEKNRLKTIIIYYLNVSLNYIFRLINYILSLAISLLSLYQHNLNPHKGITYYLLHHNLLLRNANSV